MLFSATAVFLINTMLFIFKQLCMGDNIYGVIKNEIVTNVLIVTDVSVIIRAVLFCFENEDRCFFPINVLTNYQVDFRNEGCL